MTSILAFLCALALSAAGTRWLTQRTPRRAFVDVPGARSSHDWPKPRFGGIAIVGAFFATYAMLCVWQPPFREFLPLLAGCAILFAAGVFDDWRGLGVAPRLVAQGIAAAVAIASGAVIERAVVPVVGPVEFGWLSVPLTALFIVASVNFYNFIDGIDGLAAGGALIAATFLAIACFALEQPLLGIMYLVTAGSALGFLRYNFPPSRLFMGDGGSTFFGYVFAVLAIRGNLAAPSVPLFVPVLILSSLYLDAGLTIINRIVRGERVFQPHRMHYYQRLLQIGLNHKQVTLLEYLIISLLGASALLYVRAGSLFAPFVSAAWLVAFTLAILKIRGLERGGRMFWDRRALFVIASDVASIVVAYLGAYFLRMNFQYTEPEGSAVLRALPIVVVVRSACFFKFGLYRSMWRYTSTGDVVRVIKAVSAGSAIILAAVVLLYRFVAFPRTLFVIEFVLLIVLILGSRFLARIFHEIGREPQGARARRYGVIGAGDAAERMAREINAHGPRCVAACFVDDDPSRIGLLVHGVPVEGPAVRLDDIVRRHRLDVLVYAIDTPDEAVAAAWVDRCRAAGIALERAPGIVAESEPDAIVMDRVARAVGRVIEPRSPRVAASLRGRTVLVTHAGSGIAGALVGELRAAGAVVVVHGATAAVHAAARVPSDVARVTGSLVVHGGDMVASVAPEAVIHVVDVEPAGGLNDDEYLWEHLVRETESLARSVWRRPGCRLVVAGLWGSVRAGQPAALVAAVMEAIVLNRAGSEPVAVVRVPRVLTSARVTSHAAGEARVAFDVLETEAAALILEVAAGAFRGIYAPAPEREIGLAHARRAFLSTDEPVAAPPGGVIGASPVFPTEHLDECGLTRGRRVLSPLFPASEPFRRLAVAGPVDADRATRAEWVRVVASHLYALNPGREPAGHR